MEAGIIFPVILSLLFGFVILGAYVYQRYDLFDTAVYVSTQRAATWDNSKKNLETGSLQQTGDKDNLYWRIFEDNPGASLAKEKLARSVVLAQEFCTKGLFNKGLDVPAITYENIPMVKRQVTVRTGQDSLATGSLFDRIIPRKITSAVTSQVVEPVEFIRNVDLITTMGNQRMVVSSINSKLYHYPECPRSYDNRIKDKNFTLFYSEEEAIKAGKIRSCVYCQRLK